MWKKSFEVARKYPGSYKVLTNYAVGHGKIVNSQLLKIDKWPEWQGKSWKSEQVHDWLVSKTKNNLTYYLYALYINIITV